MPGHVKWNTERGEYYNAESFTWNSERRTYEPIMPQPKPEELEKIKRVKTDVEWMEENKNSPSIVKKAIIEYYAALAEEAIRNPYISKSSRFRPEILKSMKILIDLGVGNLPEMIKEIKENNPFGPHLMYAISSMTNVEELGKYLSAPPDGVTYWLKSLKETVSDAEDKVKILSGNLKYAKTKGVKEKAKSELKGLGLFAVPFMVDEIKKGSDELVEFLPETVDEYSNVDKVELSKKDKAFWNNWFDENKDNIEVLRKVVNDYKN